MNVVDGNHRVVDRFTRMAAKQPKKYEYIVHEDVAVCEWTFRINVVGTPDPRSLLLDEARTKLERAAQ